MLKNILNLEGAQQLSNNEQRKINGGIPVGCTLFIYTGWTQADCIAEGGIFTSTGRCRLLVCDNQF